MSDLLENWIDQLEWFLLAYPKNHRIKLSFAHRSFESTLGQRIDPENSLSFLKKNKYKHIIIDLDISKRSYTSVPDTIDKTQESSIRNLDDIDDILNTTLVPKQPSLISLQKTHQTTQMINEHLLKEYERTKNNEYLDSLVVGNMKLVYSVALRYKNYMNHSLSEEDLVQEGVFGLIDAIKRFDHSLGYSLSTYATQWIRQRVIRAIINYGTIVRIPVHTVEQIRKLKKIEADLAQQAEENIPISEICMELNITIERYQELKLIEHQFLAFASLNQYVGNEDDTELLEFVPNDRLEILSSIPKEFKDPAEVAEQSFLKEMITSLFVKLKPKQRQVIEYRFGLHDGRMRTLEEVGQIIGVTRERIRQIEVKALTKLNQLLNRQRTWIS